MAVLVVDPCRFDDEPDEPEPIDLAQGDAERFGSYAQLITIDEYRYTGQRSPSLEGPTWPEVKLRRSPPVPVGSEE